MKRFLCIISMFLILFQSSACAVKVSDTITEPEFVELVEPEISDNVETLPDDTPRFNYYEDAVFLVDTAEAVHPIFVIEGMLPDDYEEKRESFLNESANPMTRTEFTLSAMKYLATFRDGHLRLNFRRRSRFLNIDWVHKDGKLLVDEEGETAEVIAVGGVPVAGIIEFASQYYYFENQTSYDWLLPAFARDLDIIRMAGVKTEDNKVLITLIKNGEQYDLEVRAVQGAFYEAADMGSGSTYVVKHRMIDDIFYIDLRSFVEDPQIDETITAIEKAIEDGTRLFILDLRGNGGGNSLVGDRLIEAMGVDMPNTGSVNRISDLTREQLTREQMDFYGGNEQDTFNYTPSLDTENLNNVFVSVLTDKHTYSSSVFTAARIQDGNLGNIIGEPSSNSPTAFGNMLRFKLPVSGIDFGMSFSYFMRPDKDVDQDTLVPDLLVPPEDALDEAVEFLKGLNN